MLIIKINIGSIIPVADPGGGLRELAKLMRLWNYSTIYNNLV